MDARTTSACGPAIHRTERACTRAGGEHDDAAAGRGGEVRDVEDRLSSSRRCSNAATPVRRRCSEVEVADELGELAEELDLGYAAA
jgi:hypothetical protein